MNSADQEVEEEVHSGACTSCRPSEKDVATLLDMLPGRDEEPVRLALQVAGRNHVHVAYGHVVDA